MIQQCEVRTTYYEELNNVDVPKENTIMKASKNTRLYQSDTGFSLDEMQGWEYYPPQAAACRQVRPMLSAESILNAGVKLNIFLTQSKYPFSALMCTGSIPIQPRLHIQQCNNNILHEV